jgi:hypothetical protein
LLSGVGDVANASAVDEGIRTRHGFQKAHGGVARSEILDVLLPARDKTIRLRVVSTPPKELKVLLQRMKVLLPNKPKII